MSIEKIDGEITGAIQTIQNITGYILTLENISGYISSEMPLLTGKITLVESGPVYDGEYEIMPQANSPVVVPTRGYRMADDLIVNQVPYYQTSNQYGDTVYIASEV